jgi:LacI family transcriptional regulator
MNVTIREVARATGLSVATISRVLNGKGPVREETRQKVLEAAARLRWVPHVAARSLTTNETKTIGVVLPDIHGEFFSELIRGIDLSARRRGFHILVSSSHSDRSETEEVLRKMRGRVDGVIVMSPDIAAADLYKNLPEGLPAVLLNCVAGEGFDSISIDNYGGAFAMVRHLASLGHRQIAFITGPSGNHDAAERRRGWREALAASGRPKTGSLEFPGDFSDESGYRAGKKILESAIRPTAVFAANDAMAIGCLSALQESGLRVPDEIALAGFDDIPFARFTAPPLTSVHVSIGEVGARALERLLSAILDGDSHQHQHESLTATLVIRQSCGSRLPYVDARHRPEDGRAGKASDSSAKPTSKRAGTRNNDQKEER